MLVLHGSAATLKFNQANSLIMAEFVAALKALDIAQEMAHHTGWRRYLSKKKIP